MINVVKCNCFMNWQHYSAPPSPGSIHLALRTEEDIVFKAMYIHWMISKDARQDCEKFWDRTRVRPYVSCRPLQNEVVRRYSSVICSNRKRVKAGSVRVGGATCAFGCRYLYVGTWCRHAGWECVWGQQSQNGCKESLADDRRYMV